MRSGNVGLPTWGPPRRYFPESWKFGKFARLTTPFCHRFYIGRYSLSMTKILVYRHGGDEGTSALLSRRQDIDWVRSLRLWGRRKPPTVHLRLKSITGMVDPAPPNLLALPTVPPAIESMSEMVRFRARTSQIPYFRGISIRQTPSWMTNFPTVHLRPKSATGKVAFGSRTFWSPQL